MNQTLLNWPRYVGDQVKFWPLGSAVRIPSEEGHTQDVSFPNNLRQVSCTHKKRSLKQKIPSGSGATHQHLIHSIPACEDQHSLRANTSATLM